MDADFYLLIFSLILCLLLDFIAVLWLRIAYDIPIKDSLRKLWKEGYLEALKEIRKNFIPVTKKAISWIWEFIKEKFPRIVKRFRSAPEPAKHNFTDDLYYGLQDAVSDYTYKFFVPRINPFYFPIPSYIQIAFYIKGVITDDIKDEIVWALTAVFQEYMDTYGLNFQFQAFPYVMRNRIMVRLYYCEYPSEYPAYQSKCDAIMQMRSTSRPLNGADTYDRDF